MESFEAIGKSFAGYGTERSLRNALGPLAASRVRVVSHWIALGIPFVRELYAVFGVVDSSRATVFGALERGAHGVWRDLVEGDAPDGGVFGQGPTDRLPDVPADGFALSVGVCPVIAWISSARAIRRGFAVSTTSLAAGSAASSR